MDCKNSCEKDRSVIESWDMFKTDSERLMGDDDEISNEYDTTPIDKGQVKPFLAGQFVNGIGRMITYIQDSRGLGVSELVEIYEG